MTRDYSAAIDAVFGQQEESGVATAANIPFGAVDTSGGISAALDAEPGMVEQAARERLTPPVAQESPVSDYADPTAGWYTPPEESLSQGISTEALRGQMAEREILRHAYLPEGPEDDGTGGLLRASFMLNNASRYSQDDVFTAATAAAALGMPYDMTLESLPTAKDMLAEFTPANIKDFAPGFLRLVQYDYDAAMLWRHDLPTANSISRAFESFFADDSRLAALGRGLDTVSVMGTNLLLNLGRLGLEGLGSLVRGVDENYRPADLADKPIAAVLLEASDSIRDAAQAISRAYKDRAAKSPLAGMRVWDNPEILLDARWWLENTPAAAASLLPILGAYVKGGAAAAGLTGLALNSNEVYADLLDDGLQDDAGTRLYALLGGTAMSALDVVGLSGIFGGKPAVKDAVKASLVAAAKGGLKEKTSHIGKRAGQAYLFEGSTEWLQNLIKAGVEGAAKGKDFGGILSDMSEAVTEVEDFILGGLLGGFIGGGHARAQVLSERDRLALLAGAEAAAKSEDVSAAKAEAEAVAKENAEAQRRMAFAQTMLAAADATDNSAMHQADPAIFEREAEKLIPEDARALWLDVDVVQDFVEGDLSRLDALGLTGQDMADALQTQAGMVQVSTSRLLSRFAGDERALLLQNARMVPGGMTLTEAQAFDPQKRAEAAAERIRARNRANAEISRERTRIKDEFVRAGYAAHIAEYYATMHAEQAKTFADRYGLDAARLLQERSIVRQEAGAGLAKDALLTPMVQATDASVVDFSRRVSTAQEEKKSYFRMNPATGLFGGLHVDLPADTIRHKGRRHPDMTDADMERLPRVLEAVSNRQAAFPVKDKPRFTGKGILGWAVVDGQAYGVIVESVSPTRGIVATYFKNTEENIKNWIEKSGDKNKAVTTPAALWPAQAPPVDGNALRERPVKPNIPTDQRKSNTFDQLTWHGTPHRFDKFTLDHIGEGEGNQAHGWGLYFAGTRETSEGYREKLAQNKIFVDGQEYVGPEGTSREALGLAANALRNAAALKTQKGQINRAIRELDDMVNPNLRVDYKWNREAVAVLENLRGQNFTFGEGQLFEVDIPENDVLLDEQKPLTEQPEAVRRAIFAYYKSRPDNYIAPASPDDLSSNKTGKTFYDDMVFQMRMEGAENPERAASELLNELGVKGITYDGRQDGRCFVVFDDQAIKVLQTYYQFIGEQSAARLGAAEEATTRLDNLTVARDMEAAGRDARAVKLATGWERGADGKWRYEIDDSGIRISRDGDFLQVAQDPEYARYAELTARLFNNPQDDLTEQEYEELGKLEKKHMDTALALRGKVNSSQATLADVLDAPELYVAYPFLRDVKLAFVDAPNYKGAYQPETRTIYLRKERYWSDRKDVLLHEIQHAIQFEEGFARGGSPSEFQGEIRMGEKTAGFANSIRKKQEIFESAPDELKNKIRAINRAQLENNFDEAEGLEAALSDSEREIYNAYSDADWHAQVFQNQEIGTPQEAYRRLAGEVEARNTSARMNMTAAERLASLASETEDVAREDQIILREGLEAGAAMSMSGTPQARGAVSFDASGASVLSIFEGAANLSTPIHESAHIFINDLIRVVADGGRIAEQRYTQDYMAVQNDAGIDDALKQRRQRILLKRWNRHKMGIIRAREDLSALVDNANAQREAHSKALGAELPPVTLEDVLRGTATPEQLRTLQEVNAVSFEGYVREGKAPSGKLAAVFHKMRQWLAALYRLATIHGVKPTPEVRRVFDRMLATDEAIHKSDAVSALAAEGEFLAAVQDTDTGEWTKTDRINFKASLNQESEYDRLMDLYEQAEADVSARMDKATLRDRNKRWRAYYNEGKELAAQDVYYEILAALSVKADNPLSGISREWLQRQYGHAAVQDFMKTAQGRKILNKHGGQALDAVGIGDIVGNMARAKAMGIADADGLYNYLYDNVVVRRRNLVNDARGWADQRMADDDAQAEAAGDEPGDAYRKYLEEVEATVLRLAARQGAAWRTPEQQARWVEEHRAPLARVRQRVKEVLRGKRLRDIQPNQFVGEVRKALLTRNAALTAGNALDALAAVDRARTALESWIEANRIRKEQEAFERLTSRLAGLKRNVVVPEAWTAIQDILERFGLAPPRRAGDVSLTLVDAISALCADSAEINGLPAIADWLLDEKIRSPYKNLTPEQLHDVSDVLKMLEHAGRQALTANRESEAAQIKEVADGGATAMDSLAPISVAHDNSPWRKWQDWMRLYFGGMLSAVQWQLRQADGFSNLGPKGKRGINEERIWGGIVDGESRREVRMRGLVERMEPIFRRLTESAKEWENELGKNFVGKNGKPLPVPEVMRRGGKLNWTADRVIALCLNLGNEGNVLRLREGYPDMAPATLAQLVGDGATRIVFPDWQGTGNEGLLSAQDWRDVQEIGNILHSQWSDIQATHARMFGFKPRGVDARPFNIRVNGETLSLKGWYYPAVYDPSLSEEVKLRQQREDAVVRTEAVCAAPAAKKGFTYGRSNTGGGAPLLLETGVIMAHLNDVTRFIELAEIVRFADRVTRSPQWRDAYIRAFGRQDYDAIRPNLKGVVLEERPTADAMSKIADWLRERVVPWGLSFNIKTAILQSTALFPAMNDLGATNVLRGVAAVAKGRYVLVRQIWEQSPYMRSRAQNIDQDLRKTLRSIDARTRQKALKVLGNELTWQDVVDAGMLPLISVDMAASAAVWMAGYNREMSKLMNSSKGMPGIDPSSDHHTAAVRAADMAVKAVNPDFNPSSRSQFLRSRGLARMLNIFSSAVVLFAQRRAYNAAALRQAWKASAGNGSARLGAVGTYARYEVYDFALQGVAMGLIMSLVYGEDDPQKYATNMLEAWLDAAAMRVPVFNNMITGLVTGETWRGMSTVYQQPWELAKRVSGAMHKGDAEKLTASMADVIGFLCKVPFSRVLRNAGRGHEQWLRGDGTPFSVVMPRPNSY